MSLHFNKVEYLQEVEGGDSSAASFMTSVEECISERECISMMMVHDKVKLALYRTYSKVGLYRVSDAGSRLFRSGMHGLNEELGIGIEGGKRE